MLISKRTLFLYFYLNESFPFRAWMICHLTVLKKKALVSMLSTKPDINKTLLIMVTEGHSISHCTNKDHC